MNYITIIFIFITLLYLKQIILIIFLLPIKLYCKRQKRKMLFEEELVNDSLFEKKENQSQENGRLTTKIIYIIIKYLSGYIRYSLFQVGLIPSHTIRNLIYKHIFLIEMNEKSIIYFGAEIRAPYKLKIGKGSIIGDNAILDARSGIIIEEYVNFSSNVSLWTLQHEYNCPEFSTNNQGAQIIIKKRAWIGPNVTILPGITIGEGAVIGAGAVVTKNVEPFSLYGGIPAKKIGVRNSNLTYEFNGNYTPFY